MHRIGGPLDSLADYEDEWSDALHGVGEESRIVYIRAVRQLRAWLRDNHSDVDHPNQVTRQHINAWQMSMVTSGKAASTRRRALIAVRLWFKYLLNEPDARMRFNPAQGAKLAKVIAQPVDVISDENLKRLFGSISGATFIDRRDLAILRIMFDTGARREEVVGINLGDVDLKAHEIILRKAKGGRLRIVPIGSKATNVIRKYLRARSEHIAAGVTDALFLSTRIGSGNYRMKGDGVWAMLGRRCCYAGIPPFNPHRLRNTWATDLLANGAQETDVQRLGGWSGLEMVQHYTSAGADQRARMASKKLARGDRL